MADRVSASITLGGTLSPARYGELSELNAAEGLATEWDGEAFEPDYRTPDEPLQLFGHEVPWGRFEQLETWCVKHGVPFARWAGGYPGEWEGEHPIETVERLGIGDVFLAGWHGHDELPRFLSAADVLVHASVREQFGQVLVEGLRR